MQGTHLIEQKNFFLTTALFFALEWLGNVKSEGDLDFKKIKLMMFCRMDWRRDTGGSRDASWGSYFVRAESSSAL